MFERTIKNPKTGRENRVKAWPVDVGKIRKLLRRGAIKTARDMGLHVLSDETTLEHIEETRNGEGAGSNFALNIVENALDWSIGFAVLAMVRWSIRKKKIPFPCHVATNRKGDVFLILQRQGKEVIVAR